MTENEKAAYLRGAGAMREAAARYIEVASPSVSIGGITMSLQGTANKIRSLPLPVPVDVMSLAETN